MKDLILAIDQGTTGTTVLIVDKNANILAKKNNEFPQYFPKPGWVEHDPKEIWESTTKTIGEILNLGGIASGRIAGIGITNQRETTLIWNRSNGIPIHHAIVWQDRRTSDFCAKLKKAKKEAFVKARTGLVLDPYFSGTKIRWLLEHVPNARNQAKLGELAFGTIDTFLVWMLSGGKNHVTDVSNASRTLLMNLHSLSWDDELLKIMGINKLNEIFFFIT